MLEEATDTVTVLRSLSSPQAKQIIRDGDGLDAATKQTIKYFNGTERSVHDIRSLAAVLDEASKDPFNCVVRGKIIDGVDRTRMRRPDFDPYASPAKTVDYVKTHLPPAFPDATCWYQFTGSAGVKPGLRIRLGFWFNRPLGVTELKRWLGQKTPVPGKSRKDWFKEYPVDTAVFSAAQVNYVAAPIIEAGACDPLEGRCKRSGLIVGKFDAVIVPEIPAAVARASRPSTASTAANGVTRGTAASFDECLAEIGDHPGGCGCYEAARHAIAIYYHRYGAAADPEALRAKLEKRIHEAQWDAQKHSPEYRRQKIEGLPSLIKWVQFQQRDKEELAAASIANAASAPLIKSVTLAEAENQLTAAIDAFFAQAVPEGRQLRAAHREEWRRPKVTEDLGAITDADGIFDDASIPAEPQYAQHGIKVTAGAGKTRAAIVRMIADTETSDCPFVYAIPTHQKAEEIAADINRRAGELIASVYRGIERPDPEAAGQKMCRRHETVREINKAGGAVSDLCGSKARGFCPFHPPVDGACGYRRQFNLSPKIWLVPHTLLMHEPPAIMKNADALIVDEAFNPGKRGDDLPVDVLLAHRAKRSPLDRILPQLDCALKRVSSGYLPREVFATEGMTPRRCRVAEKCERYEFERVTVNPQGDDDVNIAGVRSAGEANRLAMARIAFWRELALFLEGDALSAPRLRMLSGGVPTIRIDAPHGIHPEWLNRPVLHLAGC
jgi:hypothetical protein